MNWLLVAAIAYFIYALDFIGDRVLVVKAFKQPIAYAFYTGLLHSAALFLIPLILFFSDFVSFLNIGSYQQLVPANYYDLVIEI